MTLLIAHDKIRETECSILVQHSDIVSPVYAFSEMWFSTADDLLSVSVTLYCLFFPVAFDNNTKLQGTNLVQA